MDREVWINSFYLQEHNAVVSVYDSAMMFGDTVFEMTRTFNNQTFRLKEHINRLFNSMKFLQIEIPYSKVEIFNAYESLLHRHIQVFPKEEEWRMLINVTRGILPMYVDADMGQSGINVTITCFPLRYVLKGKSHLYKEGVRAIIPSQRAIPHHLLDARIKSRSRQHYQMANLEVARQDPEAWALLMDEYGYVCEGTGSNFFIVNQNKEIVTPKPINCLRGVSRDYIMKMIKPSHMIEDDITLYDIVTATEAFFTCTPFSILPCTSINGMPIGDGQVGKITKALTDRWIKYVGCDFVSQAIKWDE